MLLLLLPSTGVAACFNYEGDDTAAFTYQAADAFTYQSATGFTYQGVTGFTYQGDDTPAFTYEGECS